MVGLILIIVAFCAVAEAQLENKWTKVEKPLKSVPRNIFRNSNHSNQHLSGRLSTGGQAAKLGQFPFEALLTLKDSSGDSYDCGGSIISHYWILTAAHCLDGFLSAYVYVGFVNRYSFTNAWTIKVKQNNFIIHEKYDRTITKNDIALVRLASSIPKHATVKYIKLPRRAEANENLIGKTGTIIGFGRNSLLASTILRSVAVPIIANNICEKSYQSRIFETNICAEIKSGKSSCYGDSGGPLTILKSNGTPVLVGILSYGAAGCKKGNSVVFTGVHSFLDWIEAKSGIQVS
ncbi:unnamed protein product [Diamesa tonsa]